MDKGSMDSRMRQLEDARPSPPEEVQHMEQQKVVVLLARNNALDVAPLIGLDA